jgi:signal transduction histidine kinase
MKFRLIWKLLGINLLVIASLVVIIWWAIDFLAADYFMELMDRYHISPQSSHQMFVESVHRYLLWSTLAGLCLAVALSLLMMRLVLRPLSRMIDLTGRVAGGDYQVRVPVKGSDEVAALSRAFNRMAASLRRIESLRKNLVINVAHELRTPLTNMRGYLEGLLDGVVEPGPATFQLLHEESLRLSSLLDDLLELARADAASTGLNKQTIDYPRFLERLMGEWSPRFAEKGIRVSQSLDPAASRLPADPARLSQILTNLLGNALLYTSSGGRFKISTRQEDGRLVTSLENTSTDLSQEDLPQIFERFYRGEKSRSRDYGGAGIGLAIVKDLVEAHQGRVGARLEGDTISIFFSLPLERP